MDMATHVSIRQQKISFIAEQLRQNPHWRSTDLVSMVKRQFGTSIDGTAVAKEIQKVRPEYQPIKRTRLKGLSSIKNEVTSESKITIAALYRAGAALGESDSKVRALVLLATRKQNFVPEFETWQLKKAKEYLKDTGIACFSLSKKGIIHLLKSARIKIMGGRRKNDGQEV